jgi:cytochrome P450 family 4
MQYSVSGGVQEYLELMRDPMSGQVRPIVYSGASIAFDPMVSISDSKYFPEILNDAVGFPKDMKFYNLLDPIIGMGLVMHQGEEHRKQRKIIAPVFHFSSLRSAMTVIERNALAFVQQTLPAKNFLITQDTFKIYTLGVITDFAFSGAFDKQWMESAWHSILRAFPLQNILRIFVGEFVRYLPNPCTYHTTLVHCRVARYLSQRRRFLQDSSISHAQILQYTTEADGADGAAAATPPPAPEVSIDVGLNLADQLLLAGCPAHRIIDECRTFLFAGEDTTSSLLSWAAYELSRSPADQAAVRDELRRVLGPGPVAGPIPPEALRRLEYVGAVLKEALRLWPPFPLVPRVNRRGGLAVAGCAVPAGAVVELNVYAAHRDPAAWPEPDAFRPARWLGPAAAAAAAARGPCAFVPFLAGPRNCIGQRLAMQEAAAALAVLLFRFELRPAAGAGPVVPAFVVTLEPRGLAVECAPLSPLA